MKVTTTTQHFLFSTVGLLLFLVAILGINTYKDYRKLKVSLEPVVINMVAVDEVNTRSYIDIRVFGDRKRSCGPPLAWAASFGNSSYESFVFLDDVDEHGKIKLPDEQRKKVEGKLDFGWWRFTPNSYNVSIHVKIFHNCDGTTVTTEFDLYPADIKRNNK